MSEVERALDRPEREALGRLLADELPEPRAQRMWREIERRTRPSRPPRWTLAFAVAASVVVLVATGWLWSRRAESHEPLALATGGTPSTLETSAAARSVAMADGSAIDLDAGTRLEVLRNDDRSFVTALRRGTTTFDVRPGGPRRWIVEAGLATIEVVGTRFTVRREPTSLTVRVERGAVLVRGERVPNGQARLGAGQSIALEAPETREAPPQAAPTASHEPEPMHVAPAAEPHSAAPAQPVRDAQAGDAVDALLAAADAARREGDRAKAVRLLERVVAEAPEKDPRRGLAALSLARLTVQSDPERAATVLGESMGDMPAGLAEDALARRVEAEARAGRRDEAARLAAEYLKRFPNGHRADDVRRWSRP